MLVCICNYTLQQEENYVNYISQKKHSSCAFLERLQGDYYVEIKTQTNKPIAVFIGEPNFLLAAY